MRVGGVVAGLDFAPIIFKKVPAKVLRDSCGILHQLQRQVERKGCPLMPIGSICGVRKYGTIQLAMFFCTTRVYNLASSTGLGWARGDLSPPAGTAPQRQ